MGEVGDKREKKESYSFERKWYSPLEFMNKTKAERKNEEGKKNDVKWRD